MELLQKEISGETVRTGLISDDDIMAFVKELRKEHN